MLVIGSGIIMSLLKGMWRGTKGFFGSFPLFDKSYLTMPAELLGLESSIFAIGSVISQSLPAFQYMIPGMVVGGLGLYGISMVAYPSHNASSRFVSSRLGDDNDLPTFRDVRKRFSTKKLLPYYLGVAGVVSATFFASGVLQSMELFSGVPKIATVLSDYSFGSEEYSLLRTQFRNLAFDSSTAYFAFRTGGLLFNHLTSMKSPASSESSKSKKVFWGKELLGEVSGYSRDSSDSVSYGSFSSHLDNLLEEDKGKAAYYGIDMLINNPLEVKKGAPAVNHWSFLRFISSYDRRKDYVGAFLHALYYRTMDLSVKDNTLSERFINHYKQKVLEEARSNDDPLLLSLIAYYKDSRGESGANSLYDEMLASFDYSESESVPFKKGAVGANTIVYKNSHKNPLAKTIVEKRAQNKDLEHLVEEFTISFSMHNALAEDEESVFTHAKPLWVGKTASKKESDFGSETEYESVLWVKQAAFKELGDYVYKTSDHGHIAELYGSLVRELPYLHSILENDDSLEFQWYSTREHIEKALTTIFGDVPTEYQDVVKSMANVIDHYGGRKRPVLDFHDSNIGVYPDLINVSGKKYAEKIDTRNKGMRPAIMEYVSLLLHSFDKLEPRLYEHVRNTIYDSFSQEYDVSPSDRGLVTTVAEAARTLQFAAAWSKPHRTEKHSLILPLLENACPYRVDGDGHTRDYSVLSRPIYDSNVSLPLRSLSLLQDVYEYKKEGS